MLFTGRPTEEYRRQLGSFGVSGDLALQQLASLSGGQKSRVAFSLMCMGNPNFFILDEPTNHLDIETIEALGEAINRFKVSPGGGDSSDGATYFLFLIALDIVELALRVLECHF